MLAFIIGFVSYPVVMYVLNYMEAGQKIKKVAYAVWDRVRYYTGL